MRMSYELSVRAVPCTLLYCTVYCRKVPFTPKDTAVLALYARFVRTRLRTKARCTGSKALPVPVLLQKRYTCTTCTTKVQFAPVPSKGSVPRLCTARCTYCDAAPRDALRRLPRDTFTIKKIGKCTVY